MVDVTILLGPAWLKIWPRRYLGRELFSTMIYALDNATKVFIEGAQYSDAYKNGSWDGCRHLLVKKDLKLPIGCLTKIITTLEGLGLKYDIKDLRATPPPQFKWSFKGELRDYQQEALTWLLKYRIGTCQMPPGAGKTETFCALIARLGLPTLVLVHTKDLLMQARERLSLRLGLDPEEIGQVGAGRVDVKPITVGMVQTIIRAFPEYGALSKEESPDEDADLSDDTVIDEERARDILDMLNKARVLICDESHHIPAWSFYLIAQRCNAPLRYGFTATPWRSDKLEPIIFAALGDIRYKVTCSDLIEKGYLVPADIRMVRIPPRYYTRNDKYPEVYRDYVVENEKRNEIIARIARQAERPCLILTRYIRHAETLKDYIDEAEVVKGEDPLHRRSKLLEEMRRGEPIIVISTPIFDEGIDIPALRTLILAGAGRSPTKAYQRVGRALRPHKGKSRAVIYDMLDSCKYLADQAMERIRLYKTEPLWRVTINERV